MNEILIGYLSLFLSAFGAATLLPLQSEALLLALLFSDKYLVALLLLIATFTKDKKLIKVQKHLISY